MAFELSKVVPWGRNLDEYKMMFNLRSDDLEKSIASFGDGPASFNSEMTNLKRCVTSFDPIYQFNKEDISNRIKETKDIVAEQTSKNKDNFIWDRIKNVDELLRIRIEAMNDFLEDFERGKKEKRYIPHELPSKTNFSDKYFDIGLSSHFLLLYSELGLDFHIKAINEMLRICKEIRIFPVLNLDGKKPDILEALIQYYNKGYNISIVKTLYEFQKGGNKMLLIK